MTKQLAHLRPAPIDVPHLVSRIEQRIRLPTGARLTQVGIIGLPVMPVKRVLGLTCRLMRQFEEAGYTGHICLWAIGDAVNAGERQWGDTYTDALAATGYAYQTIANAAWVAGKVPHSLRRETLSWTHHEVIAALPHDEQEHWLELAELGNVSTRSLRDLIQKQADLDAGRDPIVADAERALEKARLAVERVPIEQRAEVVYRALVEPLAGIESPEKPLALQLRGEHIVASVNGSEARIARVLLGQTELDIIGRRLLFARAGIEMPKRLSDGKND